MTIDSKLSESANEKTIYAPFVSVFAPVYNGAEFLEECIQSVPYQMYSNWEYLIANNQGTDNSLEIFENTCCPVKC